MGSSNRMKLVLAFFLSSLVSGLELNKLGGTTTNTTTTTIATPSTTDPGFITATSCTPNARFESEHVCRIGEQICTTKEQAVIYMAGLYPPGGPIKNLNTLFGTPEATYEEARTIQNGKTRKCCLSEVWQKTFVCRRGANGSYTCPEKFNTATKKVQKCKSLHDVGSGTTLPGHLYYDRMECKDIP